MPTIILCVVAAAIIVFAFVKLGSKDKFLSCSESILGEPEHKSNIRYQRYDEAKKRKQAQDEIDRILDKISEKGMHSISEKEHERLREHSLK